MLPDSSIYDGVELLGLKTDLRGWHSDHPIFKRLIDETKPSVIFEVGSWKGASAIHMAELCDAKIYCIDTWLGGIDHLLSEHENDYIPKFHGYPQMYFQFLHNVKAYGKQHKIIPIPQTSTNGWKLLVSHGIRPDLVYIDGSHEEVDVSADLHAYWPLTTKVMFGDDIGFPGVFRSVNNFLKCKPAGLINAECVDNNFWVMHK